VKEEMSFRSATGVKSLLMIHLKHYPLVLIQCVEIARLALHKLTDGRIHPARIEELLPKQQNKLMMKLSKLVNEQ
jgi:hypothetical protein